MRPPSESPASAESTTSRPSRAPMLRGLDPWIVAATSVVAVALIAGSVDSWVNGDGDRVSLGGVLVLGLVGLVFALRGNVLAAVVAALLVGVEVRDPAPGGTWAVAGALLFMFALQRQRLDAVLGGVAFAAVAVLVDVPWSRDGVDSGVFGIVTLAAAMVGIGQWVQAQRKYVVAEVGRRREEAERRRVEVARHVAEERLRIARDLHDSVAHHIAVVSVQTSLARANLGVSVDAADLALQSAQTAARDVLSELQLVLGVLREEPHAAGTGADVRSERIHDLTSRYQEIGLHIESTGLDLFGALSEQTRVAVYRILQEALTNAHRYGDGHVTVSLERIDDDSLAVTVRNLVNPTAVASGSGGGHGLVGMRERVGGLGGSLDTGTDGREFVVRARVPASAVVGRGESLEQ